MMQVYERCKVCNFFFLTGMTYEQLFKLREGFTETDLEGGNDGETERKTEGCPV